MGKGIFPFVGLWAGSEQALPTGPLSEEGGGVIAYLGR